MSLRFFADHCVPEEVVRALEDTGFEAFRLRQHLQTDAPDRDVIFKAQELEAILVSLNGDFADIVSYPPEKFRGIISLQVRNHPEILPDLLRTLTEYLTLHDTMEFYVGKLFIIEASRIRIRT
ncbi:MAG: DUF5615 family PIN-like protein [bacterium]